MSSEKTTIQPHFMFGPTAGTNGNTNLVEFKAGKMLVQGKSVTADPRKGLFYIHKSPDDQLLHFCWRERSNSKSTAAEDDLIVFPDEAEWKQVRERVYMLKFKTSSRKMLFWMQEPEDSVTKDQEWSDKINQVIHAVPASTPSTEVDGLSSQEALLRMLAGQPALVKSTVNTGTTTTTTASNSTNPVNVPVVNIVPMTDKKLSKLMTVDLMRPVIQDEKMCERLFPHFPALLHPHTDAELQSLISTPQFKHAVGELDAALQSGYMAAVFVELGLDANAIMTSTEGRVVAFLGAMQMKFNKPADHGSMDES